MTRFFVLIIFISMEEECPICFEGWAAAPSPNVPKILTCGHTHCDQCIRMLERDGPITCALCTAVCSTGADTLLTNWSLLGTRRASLPEHRPSEGVGEVVRPPQPPERPRQPPNADTNAQSRAVGRASNRSVLYLHDDSFGESSSDPMRWCDRLRRWRVSIICAFAMLGVGSASLAEPTRLATVPGGIALVTTFAAAVLFGMVHYRGNPPLNAALAVQLGGFVVWFSSTVVSAVSIGAYYAPSQFPCSRVLVHGESRCPFYLMGFTGGVVALPLLLGCLVAAVAATVWPRTNIFIGYVSYAILVPGAISVDAYYFPARYPCTPTAIPSTTAGNDSVSSATAVMLGSEKCDEFLAGRTAGAVLVSVAAVIPVVWWLSRLQRSSPPADPHQRPTPTQSRQQQLVI